MIDFLPESSGATIGIRASGKLTDSDYKTKLIPRLEDLFDHHGKLRMLLVMAPDFQGWELKAAWDDAELGLKHRAGFERIAVVGGPAWVEASAGLLGFLVTAKVKFFKADALSEAWRWVAAAQGELS